MKSLWTLAFLFALLVTFAAVFAACDDGSTDEIEDSADPTDSTSEASPRTRVPPHGYRYYESKEDGYMIAYPSDWNVIENFTEARPIASLTTPPPSFSTDGFVPPDVEDVSINAFCGELRSSRTTAMYAAGQVEQLRDGGVVVDITDTAVPVGESTGALLSWETLADNRIQISQILHVADGCGWIISLGTPPQLHEEYMPVLLEMGRSLETSKR